MFPPNVAPPVVSPTKQFVNTNQFTTIVPHIHPSHTTTVNKHKFIHEHYCPHTESCVNEVSHQHVNCGCPRPMKPFCGC
nr:CotD family spore coat protein [Pallidibacillus pasinlerensis]